MEWITTLPSRMASSARTSEYSVFHCVYLGTDKHAPSLRFSNCENVTTLAESQIIAGPAIVEVSEGISLLTLSFAHQVAGREGLEET